MLCGTSELQQLLVNREVFWSKMTPSALVWPPPVRWREKGEMVLQGQADVDSSHGTRSLNLLHNVNEHNVSCFLVSSF